MGSLFFVQAAEQTAHSQKRPAQAASRVPGFLLTKAEPDFKYPWPTPPRLTGQRGGNRRLYVEGADCLEYSNERELGW